MATKQKFATQVDADLLAMTRQIAESEGRQLQSIVEEALLDLVEKRKRDRPRANVLAHYEASLAQFGSLYERLAR
ncbi:MAG: hypothetical protein KIS66_13330 [Fimbriimonadaceae bacterium]|nr:hypothetical protein [Fimbriimonadaceae bacterium]